MRIAVLNLFNGHVNILNLSEDAEKAYMNMNNEDFFESLGYSYDSIDWSEIIKVEELNVFCNTEGVPYIDD